MTSAKQSLSWYPVMVVSSSAEQIWPMHLKPQEDELLSSWLVRLSIAHGLKPYIFGSVVWPAMKVWASHDVDRIRDESIIKVLSEKTATVPERVIDTTLTAYEGRLYEVAYQSGTTAWIMLRGVIKLLNQRYFGLQFCPQCLCEDKQPYFRRVWRLAFNVMCTKHSVLLFDRCETCDEAVNFYLNVSLDSDVPLNNMTVCYNCQSDYRDSKTKVTTITNDDEITFQKHLLTSLHQGWGTVSNDCTVHSLLYFEGLRHMAYALTGSHEYIKSLLGIAVRYYGLKVTFPSVPRKAVIENLNVLTRRALMLVIERLLKAWPHEFVNFSKANKVECDIWDRKNKSLPFWLWSVVHLNMKRHSYTPSEEELSSIYSYISKSGGELSRSELCKYLNPHSVPWLMRKKGLTNTAKYAIRPNSLRRKAVRLVLKGHSLTQVARLMSVSTFSVSSWVKAYRASQGNIPSTNSE